MPAKKTTSTKKAAARKPVARKVPAKAVRKTTTTQRCRMEQKTPEQLKREQESFLRQTHQTYEDATKTTIQGLRAISPDAPTVVNEAGGGQSELPFRFDLLDHRALFAASAVLHEGAQKYGEGNWKLIPTQDHLNHALVHIYAWLGGDRSEDHLVHAFCRIMFATHQETNEPF